MELFPEFEIKAPLAPLADRLRPESWKGFAGQEHLVGEGLPLRDLIESGSRLSFILWGPPGAGKTTLARIAARLTESEFCEISAVNAGVADIRKVIEVARQAWKSNNKGTVLFIDEIHRFNKAQQDAVLPHIENGTIRLIGSTTENPSFEVIPALRSRCQTFRLESLERAQIRDILDRALIDSEKGLGKSSLQLSGEAMGLIVSHANGDARRALNVLEAAHDVVSSREDKHVNLTIIEGIIQKAATLYDKKGTEHYDHASAFQKSLRGSDADAAIYWLAKMISGGEDPRFIVRRLLVTAAEDVGNADPNAFILVQAVANAVEKLGFPEARIPLAQAVIYVAQAPKENSAIVAIDQALNDIQKKGLSYPVPDHLKDTHYKDAKSKYGFGVDYKYPHDEDSEEQEYLPNQLKGRRYVPPFGKK
ncbi:MAG: replication-associated recombination protein A [Nitrospina sp.]|jgi:putative ATPase|nr:replication-associated recombination protein A [Nitrospina sp.]MBT3510119.1 replication-associated recombination protein A [Nitrospina sp.]MBT3877364.1 replication-associated recombination protein A [Nitrospina sp.]MBT4046765.1 replication-associated recombination protein A [Nitrospina sp.]MBT4557513.1 replication-associated recombination protein A [Nitrospina sp.]